MTPLNFNSCPVSNELTRPSERLLERRRKQALAKDGARIGASEGVAEE
jgi:hypothetical protein